MRRAALKIAPTQAVDHDDYAAMSEALVRLFRVATQNIGDVVGSLSASERARLAVFCYGRAHLNPMGLAIAAQCDLDHLIVASSSATAGRTLFVQSREAPQSSDRPAHGRRSPITLATSASSRLASLAPQLLADLPA